MSLNPLEQLNILTMVGIAVIFLATTLVLRKVFFVPLITVMEERDRKLERARRTATAAGELVERSHEEAARVVAEATEEADRMLQKARDDIARARELKLSEASAEAQSVLSAGRGEVLQIRTAEEVKLREQLLVCSRQSLAKMIGEVDEDSLRFVVSKVLASRKAVE